MLQYMQVQIFINDDKNDILDMKNKNKSKLAIAGTIITLGSGLVSCGGDANKVVQDINPSTPLENADSTPSVDTTKASVVVVEEMLDSLPPEPEPKVEPKNKTTSSDVWSSATKRSKKSRTKTMGRRIFWKKISTVILN